MNLSEEKKYQMRQKVYEKIGLTEKNQKIAEDYLDMTGEEKKELLEQVERQSFAELTYNQRRKSVEYIDYLEKRKQQAEEERYKHLMFAIGGSTSAYVFSNWAYTIPDMEIFEKAQTVAMQAELLVQSTYMLNNRSLSKLWEIGRKDPEILREAMEYCYNPVQNANILLLAVYLNCKEKGSEKGNFLKGLLKGKDAKEDLEMQISALKGTFLDSFSPLFQINLSNEEEAELQAYVKEGNVEKQVPNFLYQLRSKVTVSEYLMHLLAGSAFLVVEHMPQAAAFLRVLAVLDYRAVHAACVEMADNRWFNSHEELLEKVMNMKPSEYMAVCVFSRKEPAAKRMVNQYPEAIEETLKNLTVEEYGYLMNIVKTENPSLHETLYNNGKKDYFEKLADEVVNGYGAGKTEAKAYILGEKEIASIIPFINDYKKCYGRGWSKIDPIKEAKKGEGEIFYRRALIFMGLAGETYALSSLVKQEDLAAIEELMSVFEEEKLPIDIQLDVAETVYNSYYGVKAQTYFINEIVKVYAKKKEEWGQELVLASQKSNVIGRYISIRFLAEHKEAYKKEILACAADGANMIRAILEAVLMDSQEWEEDIKAMLFSRKAQERETAVNILKKWDVSKYQEDFEKALEKEKSKKVKEMLADCLGLAGKSEEQRAALENDPAGLVKEIHKGGKKRKIQWAYETPFVTVHKKDGQEACEEYLQAVALCYADMAMPGVNKQAVLLAEHLNPNEFAIYATEMFDKWLESGAEAKKKWVLYFASIHGGDVIVPKLVHQINEWPKLSRGAIAAEAVNALALNGSQTALLTVDGISRKFKFKQVKAAAGEALEYAAKELGISKEELSDRIVPDLGFDAEAKRTFNYGERSFVVYLTPSLELEVFDDNGKKLKNIPSPGKKDDPEIAAASYESFKLMKKQMKTVLTNQKQRLELALSSERQWTVEKWQELFVKNPVMHQFAISLIWGVYNQDGLVETFRYMEDGSFNTKDEDEFEFPTEGNIGLVHPIELDEETKEQWKEQLSDYEVTQAIEQLERTVYEITEEEKDTTVLTRVAGKLMNAMSLSGKLQAMGWYRGSIMDGGCYDTYYREDVHMAVQLNFSGTFVGGELEEEITVYGAKFYKPGTVEHGSYVYDEIKKENLYKLGDVSPRYFSEIVYQLEKATASSTETVEVAEEQLK